MAKLVKLPTYNDNEVILQSLKKILPFEIKRVYYIYGVKDNEIGFHKHKNTKQALISISGICHINVKIKTETTTFILDGPNKCLILQPQDFHWMNNFSENLILLVLASSYYDKNDYID